MTSPIFFPTLGQLGPEQHQKLKERAEKFIARGRSAADIAPSIRQTMKPYFRGLMVDQLRDSSAIANFVEQFTDLVFYKNANQRTVDLGKQFSSTNAQLVKRGRGCAGFYYEFEVLYLYSNGHDTTLMAEFLLTVFKATEELDDLDRMCNRCVQNAKKRSPAFRAGVALVEQEKQIYRRVKRRKILLGVMVGNISKSEALNKLRKLNRKSRTEKDRENEFKAALGELGYE
jgi:hypothetical protein